ncbi:hypothetical protein SCHPADRAFT_78360 [Schizopora paradoxa]|uniref:Uncharacterized protein n=1 Tax=Schizopora paradoxa TaxID=27342 RepID=A0A0H2S4Q4_9AGAM|nr:hypothetical protein SCHPADRAFT_78360 [Schizopora paradoxa]
MRKVKNIRNIAIWRAFVNTLLAPAVTRGAGQSLPTTQNWRFSDAESVSTRCGGFPWQLFLIHPLTGRRHMLPKLCISRGVRFVNQMGGLSSKKHLRAQSIL